MTDLAIIIVSWNVCDLLATCLQSIEANLVRSRLSGQVWVVDNASTDGTVAMLRREFPKVRVIASEKNLGFARGNNIALRAIGFTDIKPKANLPAPTLKARANLPNAILLLNPDTEIHPGALKTLFDFLQNTPKAGIAGTRLIYSDGTFQHSAFAFPGLWQLFIELLPVPGRLVESSLNGRYPQSLYNNSQPFQIGHPLGAAMCVRREVIEQVGLLDEQYHMYVEEIDWSKRIVSKGWKAYCVPTAIVTHFGGQSTGQIKVNSFINLWTSRYQFYRKYYNSLKFWVAKQIVQIGMQRKATSDIKAAAQGELSKAALSKRLESYKRVTNIWQETSG